MTAFDPQPNPVPVAEAAPSPRPAPAASPGLAPKRPGFAALFSVFPGLGHVYDGLYLRGLVFFLLTSSLLTIIATRGYGLLAFPLAFFWLFNILDAYRQAVLINYGYALDLGLLDRPQYPMASQAGPIAGVLLMLIGLFALADRYLNVNLEWIFDLWPVVLIAAGAWLIVSAFRNRRRAGGAAGATGDNRHLTGL